MANRQSQNTDGDEALSAYLQSVDLQELDLSDIDLTEDVPSPAWRWVRFVALIATIVAMIWLPSTNWYQLHSPGVWLLAFLGGVAGLLGLSLAGWLWFAALRMAGVAIETRRGLPDVRMPLIPPAVLRWGMLIVALGGIAVVLFAIPREAEWQGSGYSGSWFGAVGIALTAGIMLGRWLIAQADAPRKPRAPVAPFVMPSWVKWVTLTILVLGGLFASFGHHVLGNESESTGFAMAGVGFSVGILGAIWLARRFDELEDSIRARHRRDQ